MTPAGVPSHSWLRVEEQQPDGSGQEWTPITEWLLCESYEAQMKAARDLCDEALRHEAETNTRCRIVVTVDEAVARGEKPTDV